MKSLLFVLCFIPVVVGAATRAVEGVATGRLPHDPPKPWSNEPITVSVVDSGNCIIAIGGVFNVRGVLSSKELEAMINDLRKSQNWAQGVRDSARVGTWNLGDYIGTVGEQRTGVNLKFFSANRGQQADVIMFVKDHASAGTAELYLNAAQVAGLLALLEKAPATTSALVHDLKPKILVWEAWLAGAAGAVALIALAAALIRAHRKLIRRNAELGTDAAAMAALNKENQKLRDQIAQTSKQLDATQSRHATEEESWKRQVSEKENTVRELLRSIEIRRKAELVSERMLVAAFIQLFTMRRDDAYGASAVAGIHDLSQTLEKWLGDVLAHAKNRFILIEFKKAVSEFRREVTDKAEIREPQIRIIKSKQKWIEISIRCHFGAWGSANALELVEFAPYLSAWDAAIAKTRPVATATLSEFINGFLPPVEAEARFGAQAPEFREYVKLLETRSTAGGVTSETTPFMLVVRSESDEPQFVPIANLNELISLVIRIEKRLAQELSEKQRLAAEKQRLEAERKLREEKQRPKHDPPGHSL